MTAVCAKSQDGKSRTIVTLRGEFAQNFPNQLGTAQTQGRICVKSLCKGGTLPYTVDVQDRAKTKDRRTDMGFADKSLAGAARPAEYSRRLPRAAAVVCRTVLFAVQLLEGRGVAASQPFLFRFA